MKGAISVFVLLGLFGLLILIVAMGLNTKVSSPEPAQATSEPKDDCQLHSFAYLLALKEGNAIGAAYWKPGVHPMTLYAVRSFDEIKHGFMTQANGQPYKNPRIYYQYEVESSTRGGIPIRKRWDVVMERNSKDYGGETCALVDLREAE
jgi:hypothetical protein